MFDDLAPAFTDRFHVIAYARRGHGRSEAKPPYDTATLTEDLRGLMDALGISKASLVGWSLGGNEITAMAALHPDRVAGLVYLDAAYDWADPDYKAAFQALPRTLFDTPAAAMKSLTLISPTKRRSTTRSSMTSGASKPTWTNRWLCVLMAAYSPGSQQR